MFEQFYACIKNHFQANVKYFQSDGRGEYVSLKFKKFLATNGIIHLVSCSYTPQQNGVPERKHGHIIEIAVTLISTAHLPHNFWFHACSHAIFLINRMPC